MPRGYMMWRGRGWPRGAGWTSEAVAKDMVYVGPCRCGFGPHAYYRTRSGTLVHAQDIYLPSVSAAPADAEEELRLLKEENERLEARIRALEESLGKTGRKEADRT